jgi:hypothetical protein
MTTAADGAMAPALIAPWVPFADPGCWRQLYFFNGRVHCG